jgi:tryptophan synthase alpha chain
MRKNMKQPIDHIHAAFSQGRAALMPYFTLGYPDYETSLEVVQACVEAGADLMELGLSFSDPLADGPTIQHSTQVALENGMTTERCLDAVTELRARGVQIPLILMGYYNPILAYGLTRFVERAAEVGANGFIVPDLPPEEGHELESLCIKKGLGLSYLLSSNTSLERERLLTQRSRGFTYLVSVIGITGARDVLPANLTSFIHRVRETAPKEMPLAVGFGISTPEQAQAVGALADGIIVGSALINAVKESPQPAKAAGKFVSQLRATLDNL